MAPMYPTQCFCSQFRPQSPVFHWLFHHRIAGVAPATTLEALMTVRDVSELTALT